MSATEAEVIRWGAEGARVVPWRGDRTIAYLTPLIGARPTSSAFATRCVEQLAGQGFGKVVTSALGPLEQTGFLAAGFQVEEDLQVLCHQLGDLPRRSPSFGDGRRCLRRARANDHPAVLAVDNCAFSPFWHLDRTTLSEVLEATPRSRFCVVVDKAANGVLGYAITGRTRDRGFLQRLAVDPSCSRQGIGRALVIDGLCWLRRWRVERAMVNTQLGNDAALGLYESLGFRRQPLRLAVLSTGLSR
ncbi:MAG: hypothetical protein DLM54_01730 [Acidimicrobiales bacterium]|nr:MAG: hypothetical protein DLM54_01730 [Acidimicrobiales bacterium]